MRASFNPPWNFHRMPLRLLLVLALTACDSRLGVHFPDPDADASPDLAEEIIGEVPEEELPPPCVYPSGPYAFTAVGDTVAPMSWLSAVARPDESGRPADLEDLYCDPDVHSIFIQIVTTTCIYCPDRMSYIALLRDHWRTTGARWIFIVADAATPAEADAYTAVQGVTFGWSTNDADNTEGTNTIRSSTIHGSAVPWTGVIRTSDMQIFSEANGSALDIASIATELAPP